MKPIQKTKEIAKKIVCQIINLYIVQSLIISAEQLQVSFPLHPEKYTDELATQPRQLLHTFQKLNPIYEEYL